jgi:NitT/TauT family transport system substrate-binding protein
VLADHGGQPLAMIKYALHKMGVALDDVELVDAGGGAEIDAAFRAGRGDFVHQQGPATQQLERDGVGCVVAAVGDAIGPVAFSSLSATREWLETDMAVAFMLAYGAARRYVNETPAAEIAAAEAEHFAGVDPQALTDTIAAYQRLGRWNPALAIDRDAYEVALDVFHDSGHITLRHPYDEVIVAPPGMA